MSTSGAGSADNMKTKVPFVNGYRMFEKVMKIFHCLKSFKSDYGEMNFLLM